MVSLSIKNPEEYRILILAAGKSKRLGKPKQLLPWKGGRLLQHIIDVARNTGIPLHLSLGHESDFILKQLHVDNIQVHTLRSFEKGMGNSLAESIKQILDSNQQPKGILLLLSDQPFITSEHLVELIQYHRKHNKSVVTSFRNKFGPPVVFDNSIFNELSQLEGDKGAKQILKGTKNKIKVEYEPAQFDIDTNEDFNLALDQLKHHK